MSGCVRNIRTRNYQNPIIGFQITAKNVGDVFFETQCTATNTTATTTSIAPILATDADAGFNGNIVYHLDTSNYNTY